MGMLLRRNREVKVEQEVKPEPKTHIPAPKKPAKKKDE